MKTDRSHLTYTPLSKEMQERIDRKTKEDFKKSCPFVDGLIKDIQAHAAKQKSIESNHPIVEAFKNGFNKLQRSMAWSETRRFGKQLFHWIVGLILIALIFGFINIVLVGGQKYWYRADQKKLDQIKSELTTKQEEISRTQDNLRDLNNELQSVDTESELLKTKIELTESSYPKGIPTSSYTSYKFSISHYNELVNRHNYLVHTYNALYANYSQQVNTYNNNVKQANAISAEIGGTWYVIPVPGGRLHSHNGNEMPVSHHE